MAVLPILPAPLAGLWEGDLLFLIVTGDPLLVRQWTPTLLKHTVYSLVYVFGIAYYS